MTKEQIIQEQEMIKDRNRNPDVFHRGSFELGWDKSREVLMEKTPKTFFKGRGYHSISQLEDLMAEREELLYQFQLKIQELEEKLAKYEAKYLGRP